MLPSDRYIAEILASDLGVPVESVLEFLEEIRSRPAKIEPHKPQAGIEALLINAAIYAVLSVGFTLVASFFKPKSNSGGAPQVTVSNPDARNITNNQRFAPRFGFDSIQTPAGLGTTVPVVYANRRYLSAQTDPPRPIGRYGGVRVNLPLIWSQLQSRGGSQFLRGIFLIGEGYVACVEPNAFAIGDNSLRGYELASAAAETSSRITIYCAPNGGRITSADRIYGRLAANDPGNAENDGGADVYEIPGVNNILVPDFSYVTKPSAQTRFGLYGICPNNMGIRVNPRLRPTINFNLVPKRSGDFKVDNEDDCAALAETWRSKYFWSGRCGIVSSSSGDNPVVNIGDTFLYRISDSTDLNTVIRFDRNNTDANEQVEAEVKMGDVAAAVAGRQRTADDNLVVGELYKVGTALAVLEERDPPEGVFVSRADNDPPDAGVQMEYTFRVVRAGRITYIEDEEINPTNSGNQIIPPQWSRSTDFAGLSDGDVYGVATTKAHVFRCAIATVTLNRAARVFEVGFRSTLGIRVGGLCNFRDCPTINQANLEAGDKYDGQEFEDEDRPSVANYTSGVVNSAEERYSFFRLYWRKDGDAFTAFPNLIGMKGTSGEASYNFMRLEMPSTERWEIQLEPVSGYEIRVDPDSAMQEQFALLDSKVNSYSEISGGGVTIRFAGQIIEREQPSFALTKLEPENDLGYNWSDAGEGGYMIDAWGKLAEAFVYEELQASTTSGPEHEIVYINTFSENAVAPDYDQLAIVGLNIAASSEWTQLSQFSAYITGGRTVRKLLEDDEWGPSNLFPDILRDLLTNSRFGAGQPDAQIDEASFRSAAYWCALRRYHFDGVLTDRTNLRQWASDTAAGMLLDLVQRNGKWALEPSVVFDDEVPIKALFTAGNIEEGSFRLEFLDQEDRQPIQASVRWREERDTGRLERPGFFPVEREVLVREADRPDTDPIESFDLSDYCTNIWHAIDFACYVIRVRRLITHSVKFTTMPSALVSAMAPGDYIRVAMDYTYYDEFANGCVLSGGQIVTSREDLLGNGTHSIIAWDGTDAEPYDATLTISSGLGSPTGIYFVKKNALTQVRTYKIESLTIDNEGKIEIEAVHHPTGEDGTSSLTKNWTTYQTDENWVISL